jgi:hypothetical protein
VSRTHRFAGAPQSATAREATQLAAGERRVQVAATGDWNSFDFVKVQLRSGESQHDLTLNRQTRSASIVLPAESAAIEISAGGAISGAGREVALDTHWRNGGSVEIELPSVTPVAFLVKAQRNWLGEAGPLAIRVSHPRLLKLLTPQDGLIVLDPAAGDLAKVSATVRALVKGKQVTEPFHFSIQPAAGVEVSWDAVADNGDVLITESQVARLRVRHPASGPPPAAIEAGICESGNARGDIRSLGEKPAAPGQEEMAWFVPPGNKRFAVRAVFEHEGRRFVTPWTNSELAHRSLTAPGAELRPITVFIVKREVEIELTPVEGELSSPYRRTVLAGQPTKIEVICAGPAAHVRFRMRSLSGGDWEPWQTLTNNLVRNTP